MDFSSSSFVFRSGARGASGKFLVPIAYEHGIYTNWITDGLARPRQMARCGGGHDLHRGTRFSNLDGPGPHPHLRSATGVRVLPVGSLST